MGGREEKVNRVFIDMDGVIVDFEGYANGRPGEEVKKLPLAYLEMKPIEGALAAVRSLIGMGYNVWLATKPPTGVAHAYSAKAQWVFDHLPELKRKLIITPDKGLLGDCHDYLIDDRCHKANCNEFRGTLLRFDAQQRWPELLALLGEWSREEPWKKYRTSGAYQRGDCRL